MCVCLFVREFVWILVKKKRKMCACAGQSCNTHHHRTEWTHYYSCHNSLAVRAAVEKASRPSTARCCNAPCMCMLCDLQSICCRYIYSPSAWLRGQMYIICMSCIVMWMPPFTRICSWVCVTAWHIPSLTLALRSPVPLLCVGQIVKHPGSSTVLFCCGAMSPIKLSAALPALHALWYSHRNCKEAAWKICKPGPLHSSPLLAASRMHEERKEKREKDFFPL